MGRGWREEASRYLGDHNVCAFTEVVKMELRRTRDGAVRAHTQGSRMGCFWGSCFSITFSPFVYLGQLHQWDPCGTCTSAWTLPNEIGAPTEHICLLCSLSGKRHFPHPAVCHTGASGATLSRKYGSKVVPLVPLNMEKVTEATRKPKSRSQLLATLTGKDDDSSSTRRGRKHKYEPGATRKAPFKKDNNTNHRNTLISTSVAKISNANAQKHNHVPSMKANASLDEQDGMPWADEDFRGNLKPGEDRNGPHDGAEYEASGSNKYLDNAENGRKRKRAVHLVGASEPRKRLRERIRERPDRGDELKDRKATKPSNPKLTFIEKATPNGSYKEYKRRRVIDGNDPRLKLLRSEWLPSEGGGRVLDIGCNDGALTLHVARRYRNANILGLDIDEQLIKRAEQRRNDVAYAAAKKKGASSAPKPHGVCFPNNLDFRVEDVCACPSDHGGNDNENESALKDGHYDVVLMMSVSKWLHMKSGDEGMKRIFGRVRDSLVPGGVFILEPQGTKSYKAARRKGAVAPNLTMDKFKLKPEMFAKYLVAECGFERMEQLRDKVAKNTPFGNRPVMAFYKGKSSGQGVGDLDDK